MIRKKLHDWNVPVNTITAILFFVFGCISFYMGTGEVVEHMGHGNHMNHGSGFNWFGIGEMTVMWWTMALAHVLIHSCRCSECNKWK